MLSKKKAPPREGYEPYPKYVTVPATKTEPARRVVVQNEEEHRAVCGSLDE